jgi:hypothetical protein
MPKLEPFEWLLTLFLGFFLAFFMIVFWSHAPFGVFAKLLVTAAFVSLAVMWGGYVVFKIWKI